MHFIISYLKGIAIGAGAILPGISSGVFCVIFGIYEKLLNSILYFFKDIKNNFKFLLPIVVGVFIGVLIFSNFLNYFFINFPIQTKSIFIGLILGCIPPLIKQCNSKTPFKITNLLFLLVSFSIGILSVFLENSLSINYGITNFDFKYLILSGFIMSIGIIVPGVSNTIILMLMGVYPTYLNSVSTLYFPVLIPMGIGIFFGSALFMISTKFLLEHFYSKTFYSIIGFSLGSIFVLLPNISSITEIILSILCMFLGFTISSLFQTTK